MYGLDGGGGGGVRVLCLINSLGHTETGLDGVIVLTDEP